VKARYGDANLVEKDFLFRSGPAFLANQNIFISVPGTDRKTDLIIELGFDIPHLVQNSYKLCYPASPNTLSTIFDRDPGRPGFQTLKPPCRVIQWG
jgi:hypothetical protein